jgi:hypothetical protein
MGNGTLGEGIHSLSVAVIKARKVRDLAITIGAKLDVAVGKANWTVTRDLGVFEIG